MRDLFVAAIVFGALPFILRRPFLGILLMAGLGYMNPHRLCYGFMLSMPVVFIVALVTLIGMLISKEAKRMIWSREIIVLVIFIVWMGITTSQAMYYKYAINQYEKVVKIQILTLMTLLLLTSKERVNLLIWAIVLSLSFYGIKGGIFTILKGGVHRVQGPPGTFIAGNNELALAMVMTIPLMRYLQLEEKRTSLKLFLSGAMILTAIAAFGTQSRGALVALVCTGAIFWVKSRRKIFTAALITLAGLIATSIMPEAWFNRMSTIESYDRDESAMGRINAWWVAYRIANDHLLGGGFESFQPETFWKYAPNPDDYHDVHSIYFQVLGHHGWIGLGVFILLLGLTWLKCSALIKHGKRNPGDNWVRDLGAMIQTTMVAYLSAGAFLGLAYFDYIYHIIAIVVAVSYIVTEHAPSHPRVDSKILERHLGSSELTIIGGSTKSG